VTILAAASCAECGSEFPRKNSRQKFCSDKCRYRQKDRGRSIDCAACGKPMLRGGKHVEGLSVHMSCRGGHGSPGEYAKGCRCVECLAGNSKRWSTYRQKYFAEHGEFPDRLWIDPELRIALHERDDWTCQLCHEPVDREAATLDRLAPTLDHIVPRSHQIVPDHSPQNLRTAHRWCNSVRGNRV
jgi:HNH endonuclease.